MGILHHIKRFRDKADGATAVEFAIVFPVMLAVFGAIVEGSRIYWNYQGAVTSVRDVTRYFGRVTPEDLCGSTATGFQNMPASYTVEDGGATVSYKSKVARVLLEQLGTNEGNGAVLPLGVSVPFNEISVTYACVAGGFRTPTAPVVKVETRVDIELPFATLFTFFGVESETIRTTITDQSRVLGL